MTTNQVPAPFHVFKANLDLQLRMAALTQEQGQRLLELATRMNGENIAGSRKALKDLLAASNLQGLGEQAREHLWQRIQQRMSELQYCTQEALSAQAHFAVEVQKILQMWQKEAMEAMSASQDVSASPAGDAIKRWQDWWSACLAPLGSIVPAKKSASVKG